MSPSDASPVPTPDASAAAAPDAAPAPTSGRDLLGDRPLPDLDADELRRYGRHLSIPEVGRVGQRRLKAARVLCVGAGGLGSPVGMYLAAAGVGTLGIVDFDRVEHSNLHRQLLHDTASVGRSKLDSARRRLEALNPEVDVVTHEARLTSDNALGILEGYDLVVDGSDNFPTRYLVNDASVLLGIPSVYGAIFRFDGQASVFGADGGPCYRCLFREPPPPGLVPSCAEAGVLGVLPGIVGTIQAAEAVKLILGKGRTLAGRLLMIDALEMSFRELEIRRDPDCPVCGDDPTVTELVDYEAFCGTAPGGDGRREDGAAAGRGSGDGAGDAAGAGDAGDGSPDAVTAEELARRLEAGNDVQLLDVRRDYEWEICNLGELGAMRIPLGELPDRLDELDEDRDLVVYCRTGARSGRAVEMLRRAGRPRAMNLEGGILAWARDVDPDMPEY